MTALQAVLTINTMSERQITEGFENFTKKVENFFSDRPHVEEIGEFMQYYVGIALPSYVEDDKALKNFIDNAMNMVIRAVEDGLVNNDNISLSYSGKMFVSIKKYLKAFAQQLFVEIRNAWVL